MQTITFGKTNLRVSRLGFGGANIGMLDTDEKTVGELLNLLLDSGVNVIDTAALYAESEIKISRTVGHRRDQLVLISKCGTPLDEIDAPQFSPKLITHTVDRALCRLRTDHLDVMLLHTCDLETLKRGDALAALTKARDAGKVRFVGYSGDNEDVAYAAALPEIDVIETSVSMCDQANIHGVLPLTRERNLGVIAKRPIANAAWRSPQQQQGMYEKYAGTYRQRLSAMNITPGELGFDGDPQTLWPEIALRFTLAQRGVHTAIIGMTNIARARANIAAVGKDPLPDDVVAKIIEAFNRAQEQAGERWSGQT